MTSSNSIALATMLLVAVACSRRPSESPRDASSHFVDQPAKRSHDGYTGGDGSDKHGSASREASIKDLEHFMARAGWRFAHSPEDDMLTTIVETSMKKSHTPMPENRRFVIAKRKDGWGVFVVNFEAFLRGERLQFNTFHIGNKGGRPELLAIEAGI